MSRPSLVSAVSSRLLGRGGTKDNDDAAELETQTTADSTPASSRSPSRGSMTLSKSFSTRILGLSASNDDDEEDSSNTASSGNRPAFLSDPKYGKRISDVINKSIDDIPDESLIKLTRQLEFWHAESTLSAEDMVALTERLVHAATWRSRLDKDDDDKKFTVPKVRFGRTELEMPIVTCGGMRVQWTWLPDSIPLLAPSKKKVLKSQSQTNLKDVVRTCLRVGLNHFETARFYGTSEMQFVDALSELMESGEITRDDFIFQTKIQPKATGEEFLKVFNTSWAHIGDKLGHVDLLSFHGVSDDKEVGYVLDESDEGCYAAALKLKEEGKVRHIGFSTHGPAENVMKLVSSDRFDYVNIHYHYFGSYHGEGTDDTAGGHGNLAALKKALELDMGVFIISPFDKGGKLYRPSATVARTIGPELTPISFAALHLWKTAGAHTVSVGFARSSDLDEVLEAAAIYEAGDISVLESAEDRLAKLAEERLGKEWMEKGMLNLPTCYDERTNGVAIGHLLWLHNIVQAYGMYEFGRDRYKMLEATGWNKKKSFEDNISKMVSFNAGRSFQSDVDLSDALSSHFDAELLKKKLVECHDWLNSKTDEPTDEEKKEQGWDQAYNLTVWEEFPGQPTVSGVLLQNMTGGRMGITGTGPTRASMVEAKNMRMSFSASSADINGLLVDYDDEDEEKKKE